MRVTSAAFAVLLQGSSALRRSVPKKIAGIPLLNYRYRQLQPAVAGTGSDEYDWIIKFKDGLSDEHLEEFCEGGCKSMGHPSNGGLPLATVSTTEKKLESWLQRHPGVVEFVEPDSPVEMEPHSHTEEATEQDMYNLDLINLPEAAYTGRGSHIYVMDTGIRTTHQDFGGRAVATLDVFRGGECQPGDNACAADDRGHGTHVAGTAGGSSYGVARDAILHAMRVCCGGGTDINGGMDWVAQFAQKPAVMTMSLGSYTTPESSRVAVDAVVNSGVTVTVSAGNRGTNSCDKSYTFIASAFGVGASDSSNFRATFSNFGPCNAIFAPGVQIVSASHTSDTESAIKSGTSMAAPLAAGAAALLLEENPTLTAAQVRSELRGRATANALSGLLVGDPNLLLNVAPPYTGPPTPAPPTPAPPPPGTWDVAGSGCEEDTDGCVFSIDHPSNYGNNQRCQISLYGDVSISVEAFRTESGYDILSMGGGRYSGNQGPTSGVYTGFIFWNSDHSITSSGWKLCKQ